MIEIAAAGSLASPPVQERPEFASIANQERELGGRLDRPEPAAPEEAGGALRTRDATGLAEALARETADALAPRFAELELSVDDELGRVIAQVVDRDSGEVIRQVPPDELIEMAKTFRALNGQVVDQRI